MRFLQRLFTPPAPERPGMYQGKHYTEYLDVVRQLKRDERYDDVEQLLNHLCAAVEAEHHAEQNAPAPWYFDELAKIYRRRKDYTAELGAIDWFLRLEPRNDYNHQMRERRDKTVQLMLKAHEKQR